MGLFNSTKTFKNLKAIELLSESRVVVPGKEPYSKADKDAKALSKFNTRTQEQFIDMYVKKFKRQYRGLLGFKNQERYGFAPEVSKIKKLKEDEFLAFLQGKANPNIDKIIGIANGARNSDSQARVTLQDAYFDKWDNGTKIATGITLGGKTGDWKYVAVSEKNINNISSKIEITMENLDGSGPETIEDDFDMPIAGKITTVNYENLGFAGKWWVYQMKSSDIPEHLWETIEAKFSPVITIKEDNIMATNEKQVKLMLDKLGVPGDQLWDQMIETCPVDNTAPADEPLDCPDNVKIPSTIDNAYVFTGLAPDSTDSGTYAALFYWFDEMMVLGGGLMNISMNNVQMAYDFGVSKSLNTGSIGSVGKYEKVIIEEGFGGGFHGMDTIQSMYIRKQVDDTHYEEIYVSNFSQTWTIDSKEGVMSFTSLLLYDDTDENAVQSRLIPTMHMYNNIIYRDWLGMHETGLVLLAFSVEVVKLKWWQTGIFKIIITIVVAYFTAGSGAALVEIITQAVINFAVAMVVSAVVGSIDNQFLQILIMVVAAAFASGSFDFTNIGFDSFLKLAPDLLKAYNTSENLQLMEELKEDKEKMDELDAENEELSNKVRDNEGISASDINVFDMTLANRSPNSSLMPEQFFYLGYGENMWNYEQLYDASAAISMRKTVKT